MNDPETIQRAREIIERARLEGSKTLDLSEYMLDGSLTEIPAEVFELTKLEELSLFGNQIREVPDLIRKLTSLKNLDLTRNPVEQLPDIRVSLDWHGYQRTRRHVSKHNIEGIWIETYEATNESTLFDKENFLEELSSLPDLKTLHIGLSSISSNTKLPEPTEKLGELIAALDKLEALESLSFFGVLLEIFPPAIRNLKKLRILNLHGTGVREVPDWLGELESLANLGLGMNELTDLPLSVETLSNLESISLNENRFAHIPKILFRIKNLRFVSVRLHSWRGYEGKITQIPPDILNLTKLTTFDVEGQPIEVPPPELVKEGVDAIKNYWRQQQEVGVDYLCEAKLIILGEAGAGKTTLAKKITNRAYDLKPQEVSTEGIDVLRWSFPSAIRIKRDGREELYDTEFKVNIWDFGGQEIYHATHQFFLTRRSLYALVVDDRKEDTDFNYWLQAVELLSDQSPLLIVQNEKQDRQRTLDLATLRADFSNLREAFRINLATNRGLEVLFRSIRQELERLPHIGTPLPKTWSRVRTVLEDDARDYISLDEYFAICRQNGFKRREDSLQLSGYLHDLGICLHFQDDPVLKNTVILKPKWGTDAVYRVLDDHAILDHRGRFRPEDLVRIWSDQEYSDMRDELLRLMMRFQLCYQLPGLDAYIAPQLVSSTRPTYEWEAVGGLVLRYDYDFMPKGILTRFIVALNHLIADQNLVWKSGVILQRDETRGEIVEDYARRKITVRVSGPDSRGLLAIVDDQLERIHTTFLRLKYDKFLPCNCEICQTRPEPSAYSLRDLSDFASQGDKIQCRISRKLVDAASLIREILPSAAYSSNAHMPRSSDLPAKTQRALDSLKEVFVSYAWTDESDAIVDKLDETFKGGDITLVRDKNTLQYKDSIRDFMKRIGTGKCIVVILSKKYLESKNCMFELLEIAANGEVRDRVFPIILEDANIYDGIQRVRYLKYWEKKKSDLDAEMKGVGGEFLQGIREELDLFAKIRDAMPQIVDIIGTMNALTPEQHKGSNFSSLLKALETRLGK